MRDFIYFVVLTLIFVSCHQTNEEVDEILTLDEIIEGEQRELTGLPQEEGLDKKDFYVMSERDSSFQTALGIDRKDMHWSDSMMYVDRYESKSKSSYLISSMNRNCYYFHWEFNSIAQSKNAFMNWLQCFGKECSTIEIHQTKSISNEKIAVVLFGTDLFYLVDFTSKEYETFLEKIMEDDMLPMYAFYQNGKKGIQWSDSVKK